MGKCDISKHGYKSPKVVLRTDLDQLWSAIAQTVSHSFAVGMAGNVRKPFVLPPCMYYVYTCRCKFNVHVDAYAYATITMLDMSHGHIHVPIEDPRRLGFVRSSDGSSCAGDSMPEILVSLVELPGCY